MESAKKRKGKYDYLLEMIEETQSEEFIHRTLEMLYKVKDNNRSVDTTLEERNPNKFRFEMPSCVIRNNYTATYPHAGNGTKKHIVFKDIK